MKRILALIFVLLLLLCSCNEGESDNGLGKESNDNLSDVAVENEQATKDETSKLILAGEKEAIDKKLIGKWIDVETEKMYEYTFDGYYYEWINENFTSEKTRYIANGGKLYYYLDSQGPDMTYGIDYTFNDKGNLVISGVLEYKPMDIKTSIEEME